MRKSVGLLWARKLGSKCPSVKRLSWYGPAPMRIWDSVAPEVILALSFALALAGCTPEIGDQCTVSTDCSVRGERLCDTSQPGGYCTVFNCRGNICPDEAACLMFYAAVPGCGYSDRTGSARTARTFCAAQCESDGDCRGGYVCANPTDAPWNAVILDDNQIKRVCVVRPADWPTDGGVPASFPKDSPLVCTPGGGSASSIDASPGRIDPFEDDLPVSVDAGDGGRDAGTDAQDAGTDATLSDASSDASLD